jgi:5'-deoxynucleotidase
MDFCFELGKCKWQKRTGWVYAGVRRPESVADHQYRVAAMSLLALDAGDSLNMSKIMQMSLFHDLAEANVGDIAPADNISSEEKKRRENEAIGKLCSLMTLSGDSDVASVRLRQLWREYELGASDEAKFVKDLDRFDMLLQAFEYEQCQGVALDAFFESTPTSLFTFARIRLLVEQLLARRRQYHGHTASLCNADAVVALPPRISGVFWYGPTFADARPTLQVASSSSETLRASASAPVSAERRVKEVVALAERDDDDASSTLTDDDENGDDDDDDDDDSSRSSDSPTRGRKSSVPVQALVQAFSDPDLAAHKKPAKPLVKVAAAKKKRSHSPSATSKKKLRRSSKDKDARKQHRRKSKDKEPKKPKKNFKSLLSRWETLTKVAAIAADDGSSDDGADPNRPPKRHQSVIASRRRSTTAELASSSIPTSVMATPRRHADRSSAPIVATKSPSSQAHASRRVRGRHQVPELATASIAVAPDLRLASARASPFSGGGGGGAMAMSPTDHARRMAAMHGSMGKSMPLITRSTARSMAQKHRQKSKEK